MSSVRIHKWCLSFKSSNPTILHLQCFPLRGRNDDGDGGYPPQLSSRSIQSLKSDARTSFEARSSPRDRDTKVWTETSDQLGTSICVYIEHKMQRFFKSIGSILCWPFLEANLKAPVFPRTWASTCLSPGNSTAQTFGCRLAACISRRGRMTGWGPITWPEWALGHISPTDFFLHEGHEDM